MPYSELAACVETGRQSRARAATKLALEVLIFTASRSDEVRFARWGEFDQLAADSARHASRVTWDIPAERMRDGAGAPRPLSSHAVEILAVTETLRDGSGLIFPSIRGGKRLSDMTPSRLVKELGLPVFMHGFGTSFRTWTQKRTNDLRGLAEAALAHLVGDAAGRALARSDLFEKRRGVTEASAVFLAQEQGKAVSIG